MSLPQPPPGESRQLLQTIWDLAFETGNWPTFAELDHRWDSRHDTDVLDVLRQLPEGFANGIDLYTQPQATTRIGLTVAGAAACAGADETLATFLDFIPGGHRRRERVAAPAGQPRGTAEPDRPGVCPRSARATGGRAPTPPASPVPGNPLRAFGVDGHWRPRR
jgi:hypothetical protein